ncbi:8-oxo-dGTP diphosphatase [Psychromicrobium xiongbiense]|uniref:8-oxo-dGTP diphosphatase n=1 Tax=Psychromicrobium xiongbiense TaxID=3051184 RepID=UPI002552B8C7|nr:8-oxo-dGTP diphosphatase [Psychromicrobium sp. YIM S02556]
MPAAPVVLLFLLRSGLQGTEVLLGLKKTGFGTGKIVGIGGHVESGESAVEAAVREMAEETSVTVRPSDCEFRGTVNFRFPAQPDWDMDTAVFVSKAWTSQPVETEEIAPAWYPLTALPLGKMWQDAAHWLPALIGHDTAADTESDTQADDGAAQHFTIVMAADNEGVDRVESRS